MAAEGVAAEQYHVDDEDDGAESDAEVLMASVSIEEPHRLVCVTGEDDQEDNCRVEEIPVDILNYERQGSLTAITLAWLTNGAIWRIRPEALVVRTSVV